MWKERVKHFKKQLWHLPAGTRKKHEQHRQEIWSPNKDVKLGP